MLAAVVTCLKDRSRPPHATRAGGYGSADAFAKDLCEGMDTDKPDTVTMCNPAFLVKALQWREDQK